AGGFAARHSLDRLIADMAVDLLHRQVADFRPRAGEVDDAPAVDIDRRLPARGEGERPLPPETERLDLQQNPRRGQRRVTIPLRRRRRPPRWLGHLRPVLYLKTDN